MSDNQNNPEASQPPPHAHKPRAQPGSMLMTVFIAGLVIGGMAAAGVLLLFFDDKPSLHTENPGDALMHQYESPAASANQASERMNLAREGSLPTQQAQAGKSGQIYYLDAGSFKSLKEADAVKARLALLGMESNVEPRQVDHTQWYRLKVGPYYSNVDVNVDKAELAMNGIRSELVQMPALPRAAFN